MLLLLLLLLLGGGAPRVVFHRVRMIQLLLQQLLRRNHR
jgi:hypothetical protein